MPRIKPITEYPREYFDLFEKAFRDGVVRVEDLEYAEAKALRSHLYTFRRVLRKSEGYEDAAYMANHIKLSIEPSNLVLKRREVFGQRKLKETLNG